MDREDDRTGSQQRTLVVRREEDRNFITGELARKAHLIPPLCPPTAQCPNIHARERHMLLRFSCRHVIGRVETCVDRFRSLIANKTPNPAACMASRSMQSKPRLSPEVLEQ